MRLDFDEVDRRLERVAIVVTWIFLVGGIGLVFLLMIVGYVMIAKEIGKWL